MTSILAIGDNGALESVTVPRNGAQVSSLREEKLRATDT